MSHFDVNPTSTTGVSISAASTGNRKRFIAFGASNFGASKALLTIYDGTALAGTARIELSLPTGGSKYFFTPEGGGKSIFPKRWWTAGNAIECKIDAAGDVRVFGDVINEA